MNKFARWLMNFFGNAVALVGASLAAWHSVTVYYLITGRIEAGEEHPPLGVAAVIVIIGLVLLVAGYALARNSAAKSQIDSDARKSR